MSIICDEYHVLFCVLTANRIILDPTMSEADSPADERSPPSGPAPTSGSPSAFLKAVVGKRVVVRLVSGVDYKGISSITIISRFFTHIVS
jgi:hypothetical protein